MQPVSRTQRGQRNTGQVRVTKVRRKATRQVLRDEEPDTRTPSGRKRYPW